MTMHTARLLSHKRLKYVIGHTGPSRQAANVANSPMDHFNLFIDENTTGHVQHVCTERNKFANQNGFEGFMLFY